MIQKILVQMHDALNVKQRFKHQIVNGMTKMRHLLVSNYFVAHVMIEPRKLIWVLEKNGRSFGNNPSNKRIMVGPFNCSASLRS